MGKYFDELVRSMEWLGKQEDTFFLGQSCAIEGTAMHKTLKDVSMEKRLELPVFENTQMGMSIGMALNGTVPVSIYPRQNFLLCAIDQLVNHLDKLEEYSHGEYNPKVIIRTGVGSVRPLDPQAQHKYNTTEGFKKMLSNVEVVQLDEPEQIFEEYKKAYEREKSTILVEISDYLNEK